MKYTYTAVTKPPTKAAPKVLSKCVGSPGVVANMKKSIAMANAGDGRGGVSLEAHWPVIRWNE
jgi:hypothetical protein